ncbi:putative ribonuclease H-like domain-containing protein [Tanacetum coccineum]
MPPSNKPDLDDTQLPIDKPSNSRDHMLASCVSVQVVLRVPRRHNLYTFNLTEIQPERDIPCLLAKASSDESTKWHRRMAPSEFQKLNNACKSRISQIGFPPNSSQMITQLVAATKKANTIKASFTRPSQLKVPNISHLKPFGCHVTILNTSDHLGKFEGKANEGFIVGYAAYSKAYRYTRILTYMQVHKMISDSECDEQVIVVPSFSHLTRFSGPKVHEAFEMVDNTENIETKLIWSWLDIDLAASISAGSIDPAASISAGSAKPFPTVIEPVHADETSLPPGHSLGSSEHSTRFPSPSDLSGTCSPTYHPLKLFDPVPTKRVYVDDIIFGSTKKTWCDEFEVLMKGEFEMSVMGELTFFLGLQVKQKPDGIFISQDKYVQDMLKKFDIESVRTATTPYEASKQKSKDEPDDAVNVHLYRSMIGSLMYLTASRPNIMFAVSACSRHQVTPLTSHLNVVNKIFKYLKGQPKLGVWYPRDSPFVLEAYSDSDCAGSYGDRKSTTGKLTFHKNKFSPQWRFLVHIIQHCLNTKTGSWDQFRSSLAIALICLSDGRRFNWSSYIFKGMVNNISNAKRFLMYPRFHQIILGIATRNPKQYHVLKLSSKLFANIRLNFEGDHMPLLAAMLPPAQAGITDVGIWEVAPDVLHTIPETIQETRPEPDQSQEHIPTPPRPTTSDHIPPVVEQGHSSDPNIASFLGAHKSDPDLFTSTNVVDETLGGPFYTTSPRSTAVPPVGPTSGGAKDLATLTALSSLVSELVQRVSTLESELKSHKLLFKDVVGQLVKKVKALDLKLKTRSQKVVMSESDKEEEEEQDMDPLIKLANAAASSDAHVDVSPSANIPPSPPLPIDMSAGVSSGVSTGAPTGPLTFSPSSTTVPTSSSVPAAITIPAGSGTTPEIPSSPVRDARKGKGVAVEEPTPTHDKTFKQLEEETLARQMSQDLEMTEDQRKRHQEVLASVANYSDAAWDIILARLQENPDLTSTIFRVEFTDDDFAARMVELVNTRRKELAEQ